jgi:hypothetical protein
MHLEDKQMTTERAYTTDSDAYDIFVGGITPAEFIKGYEEFEFPVDEAIKDFLRSWPYIDETPPSWLEEALYRYVESQI